MATKIYTKKGDRGQTSLFSGRRVEKFDDRVAAVGDLDELSAAIGMARLANDNLSDSLYAIQQTLYTISAIVSAEHRQVDGLALQDIEIDKLEESIDRVSASLPPLKDFIIPGQAEPSCRLHVARAVARRAERNIAALRDPPPPGNVLAYLNRLSDLLFVFARLADHDRGMAELRLKHQKAHKTSE
jgi:cob(I)alamin adenosyltransferase